MEKGYWIFPSNAEYEFDAVAHFKDNEKVDWRKNNKNKSVKKGDIVFIYVSKIQTEKYKSTLAIQTEVIEITNDKIWLKFNGFFKSPIPYAELKQYAGVKSNLQGAEPIKEKRYVDFILNYPESLKTAQQEASKDFLQGKRVWLYKPGKQGSKWGLMLELGLMGIGWSKVGDLRQYKNEKDIESKLNELYPSKSGSQNKLNDKPANWDMCNTISKGDIIIAASGLNTLLGYGEVVGDYFYDESIDNKFASFRKVKWFCSGEWHIDWKNFDTKQLIIKTLTEISDSKYKDYAQKLLAIMIGGNASGRLEIARDFAESGNISLNLNQILYGPPGTGKTYGTIDKALEILCERGEIDSIPQERDKKKKKFDEFMEQGQIGFVTFHQSYGYEDFVEGIRPRLSGENDESQISEKMEYEIKDGIFKRMCKKANENYEKSQKDSSEVRQEVEFEMLIKKYVEYVEDQLEKGEYISLKDEHLNTDKKIIDIHFYKNGAFASFIFATNENAQQANKEYLYIETIKENYQKFKNKEIKTWRDIKPTKQSLSLSHAKAKFYFSLCNKILEFEKTLDKTTLESTLGERLKPYILIIDEINRGNISKILGELITLLEPSKRKGEKEALEVTLPYSQEPFSVPNNLYIIGTMNTADRSIALLDTALRRRFEFIEMLPNPKELEKISCDDAEIDLKELLKAMNNRIEFLLDRERTIGHSFFFEKAVNKGNDSYELTLTDLKAVFKNKILPLLQEYFYDDYAKINAVLNDNGMLESKTMRDMEISLSDDFVDTDKRVWKITDSSQWKRWNFQKIYDNNAKKNPSPDNTESSMDSSANIANDSNAESNQNL